MKPSLRISILTRDLYTCQYCGRRAPDVVLHVDHIISVADGGSNHPSNLVTACRDCNLGKSRRSLAPEDEPHVSKTCPFPSGVLDAIAAITSFLNFDVRYNPPPLAVIPISKSESTRVLNLLGEAHERSFKRTFLEPIQDDRIEAIATEQYQEDCFLEDSNASEDASI